jgi:thiamine pyrophosphokinase
VCPNSQIKHQKQYSLQPRKQVLKTIIIAGGTPPSQKLLNEEITHGNIIIAVDSGADCLWEHQIMPHYLIGDLDSINNRVFEDWKNKKVSIEQHPRNKDATDAQLALKKAISLGGTEIIFLGCLGGKRTDHLLGALGLLAECLDFNVTACLKDDHQTITLVDKSTTIHGNPGDIFSLHTYGEAVKNLSISYSKYELKNYDLKMGDARTLSNEFATNTVDIQFTSGKLLLIKNH